MTQVLRQPLSEVRYWEALPLDVFQHIIELKKESMPKFGTQTTDKDYQADPYSEENWLAQFGDKT